MRTYHGDADEPGGVSESRLARAERILATTDVGPAPGVANQFTKDRFIALPLLSLAWHPGHRLRVGRQIQGLPPEFLINVLGFPVDWLRQAVALRVLGVYTRAQLPNSYAEVHFQVLRGVSHCVEVVLASSKHERGTLWQVNALLHSGFHIWAARQAETLVVHTGNGKLDLLRRAGGMVAGSEVMQVWGRRLQGDSRSPEYWVEPSSGNIFLRGAGRALTAALWTPFGTAPPPNDAAELWSVGRIDFSRTTKYYVQPPTCDRRLQGLVSRPLPEVAVLTFRGLSAIRPWLFGSWIGRDALGQDQLVHGRHATQWVEASQFVTIVYTPYDPEPRMVIAYDDLRGALLNIRYIHSLPGESRDAVEACAFGQMSIWPRWALESQAPASSVAILKRAGYSVERPPPLGERFCRLVRDKAGP